MNCQEYYDEEGFVKFRELELRRFENTLKFIQKTGSLIDIGCGLGYWLDFLNKKTSLDLQGGDISGEKLIHAQELHPKILFNEIDIRHLPYEDNSFDQVSCMEVLEHIPEWKQGLSELLRISSKQVIITVPYDETLTTKVCGSCKSEAHLYGHINSFLEKDFQDFNSLGKLSFEYLAPPFSFNEYLTKAFNSFLGFKQKDYSSNGHTQAIICPNCYDRIPYSKLIPAEKRLKRSLTSKPENLVVIIERN